MYDKLKYYDDINLHPGDILIESSTGCIGFLVRRIRHIDMIEDDIYYWQITWSDAKLVPQFNLFSQKHEIEEIHLKSNIILGIIMWQSVNGGSFEL